MTSPTADDEHLLDEDAILVPETQSPNTFSQKLVKRLGIRSSIRKVDAATPNNNTDCRNYKVHRVYSSYVSPILLHELSSLVLFYGNWLWNGH